MAPEQVQRAFWMTFSLTCSESLTPSARHPLWLSVASDNYSQCRHAITSDLWLSPNLGNSDPLQGRSSESSWPAGNCVPNTIQVHHLGPSSGRHLLPTATPLSDIKQRHIFFVSIILNVRWQIPQIWTTGLEKEADLGDILWICNFKISFNPTMLVSSVVRERMPTTVQMANWVKLEVMINCSWWFMVDTAYLFLLYYSVFGWLLNSSMVIVPPPTS